MSILWRAGSYVFRQGISTPITVVAIATTLWFPASATAAEREFSDEQIAKFEQRMRDTRERLELSDEQVEAIKPVLRESAEKRGAILQSYGFSIEGGRESGERLGFRKARAMRSEMEGVRDETEQAMEEILDDEQMDEYLEIAEERQEEIRDRIRDSR